jgi:hypothetical protein
MRGAEKEVPPRENGKTFVLLLVVGGNQASSIADRIVVRIVLEQNSFFRLEGIGEFIVHAAHPRDGRKTLLGVARAIKFGNSPKQWEEEGSLSEKERSTGRWRSGRDVWGWKWREGLRERCGEGEDKGDNRGLDMGRRRRHLEDNSKIF